MTNTNVQGATGTNTGTATGTATTVPNTNTPTHTVIPTSTGTNVPGATSTNTFTATNTYTPTAVPTATFTGTSVEIPTSTDTVIPGSTDTITPTFTETGVPAVSITPTPTIWTGITPLPTESMEPKIIDVMTLTNPYIDGSLVVRFVSTNRPVSVTFKMYSAAFRLIREFNDTSSRKQGTNILYVPAENFSNLSRGSYYYILIGETESGRQVRSAVKHFMVMRKK
jgi:hypothetical protein